MPVNHTLKLIFIHIPKTAGTSIEFALGMHSDLETVGLEKYQDQTGNSYTLFGNGLQHLTAIQIKKILGNDVFKSYFKLSVIRNPYERLVSYVAWLNGKWEKNELLTRDEFSEFLNRNLILETFNRNKLPLPQYKYLYIGTNLTPDLILRYEFLEKDFYLLKEKIGLNIKLDKRMVSNHYNYKYYYNLKELNIVSRFYKNDCKLLGYRY
jgi:hypothetical protein